jgi:spore coat protein A
VVNRQRIEVRAGEPGDPDQPGNGTVRVVGAASQPEPWERGLKDTVVAYPEQVTRVRVRFENAGRFVWHCHIVEHEDNEMMRPYRIGPIQEGQPPEPTPS